ncbi:hypothetical protein ACFWMH_23020 [Streptomyces tendae]|uniref:hypothetical protein n=1 Tax=Streptomyces tendae TaxID=1932 RepID=UPI003650F77B
MSTSELASQVGVGSVFALWFALACRARPALRQPHQRGLWLTVLAATIAITHFQPRIVAGLMNFGVDLHTVTLTRNLIGVLSAGLVLVSMVDIARARHFRRSVALTLAVAIGTLLILDLLQLSRPGDGIMSVQGPADQAAAYWLILIVAHLIGDTVALVVCWAFSLRSSDRDLVWSLRLFAVGSVFAIAFWSGYLWLLYDGTAAILPYLSLVIGVHGFIRAASLLGPHGDCCHSVVDRSAGHLVSVAAVARPRRSSAPCGTRQPAANPVPGSAAAAFTAGAAGAPADHRDV